MPRLTIPFFTTGWINSRIYVKLYRIGMGMWRNRNTRSTQNAMALRPCGFKSHHAHKMPKPKLPLKDFKWSPELAYVVGLLVTDGCLSSDGRHIIMRSSEKPLL